MPQEKEDERVIYDVTEGVPSRETRKKYAYHFKQFLDHFEGITRESLLEKAKDVRVIEAMIIRWIKYLSESRNQKHNTIHNEVAAVIHFFEWNNVTLNKKKINRSIPQDAERKQDRAYTDVEIQRIISKCNERNKVIILLMCSTGMRLGALPTLRFKDLHDISYSGYDLYRIDVYARTPDSHYTFCTPECKKAIDEYLIFREIHGETIDKDSPLIRELFDTRVKFAAARPNPVKVQGLETLMHRLLKRSEVKSADVMRSHGLRKFAITQMIQAKLDYNVREFIVGHKHSVGLDIHYDRSDEDYRLAEYVKAIPLLTIDPKQRLRQENAELRKNQSDYLAELGELKEDFNEMKEFLVNLNKDNQKKLVKQFHEMTTDKVQDEWWASDDAKKWQASLHKDDTDKD